MQTRAAYDSLEKAFERVSALRSISGLLNWDSAVGMPAGAAQARAVQDEAVVDLISQTLSDKRLTDWAAAADDAELDAWQAANLREMRRELTMSAASPPRLVGQMASASAVCELAWREARAQSNVAIVRPDLEKLMAIARDLAAARGEALGLSPFDAMMEAWEPGARSARLERLFDQLTSILPAMAREAAERAPSSPDLPERSLPPEALMRGAEAMAAHLGFDTTAGRLDACAHDFFMDDNPDDIRIGLRLDPGPLLPVLTGLIHEIGHARHERNGPKAWRKQPVGRSRSAAIQESQALLLEMMVGHTDAFWRQTAPRVTQAMGVSEAALDWRLVGRQLRRVRLSPIRVAADEITYGLHIALRFRLERDLIEGRLSVRDLPDAWNAEFERIFGFRPANDREGCLQDIHWHRGLFGYFPSYAQGQWAAAQFTAAAERDLTDLWDGDGRFEALAHWVESNVHALGSLLVTDDLMVEATGEPLSPNAFLAHIERRYLNGAAG